MVFGFIEEPRPFLSDPRPRRGRRVLAPRDPSDPATRPTPAKPRRRPRRTTKKIRTREAVENLQLHSNSLERRPCRAPPPAAQARHGISARSSELKAGPNSTPARSPARGTRHQRQSGGSGNPGKSAYPSRLGAPLLRASGTTFGPRGRARGARVAPCADAAHCGDAARCGTRRRDRTRLQAPDQTATSCAMAERSDGTRFYCCGAPRQSGAEPHTSRRCIQGR